MTRDYEMLEYEMLEFERDMRIYCILIENPGMQYAEAKLLASQEEKEEDDDKG